MALSSQDAHRPSSLKQQNKKHNTLGPKTKRQLKAPKGQVSVKVLTKKHDKDLSREVRRHKAKQHRTLKREETTTRKRALGTDGNPPFLVTVVPLNADINPRAALASLIDCDSSASSSTSPSGVVHISCSRFKQRYSFVIPPVDDLYAILDSVKVSDTVLFLWPAEEDMGNSADLVLSSVLAQGLPSPVHAVVSMEHLPTKTDSKVNTPGIINQLNIGEDVKCMNTQDETLLHIEMDEKLTLHNLLPDTTHSITHRKLSIRQRLLKEIESRFPGPVKLHYLDRQQDALLVLRQIGAQKQRPVFYRDHRPHMLAEKVTFEGQGTSGTLKVFGYIRGKTLSANHLVHIPGWGEFQLSQIDYAQDPFPLDSKRNKDGIIDEELILLQKPDPNLQEDLKAFEEVDPMEGDQTWPTEEEIMEAEKNVTEKTKKRNLPKGTSSYQAAWILDSDEEDNEDDDDDEVGEYNDRDGYLASVDAVSQVSGQEHHSNDDNDDNDDEYETMTTTDIDEDEDDYDGKMDYDEEMEDLIKFRTAKEDVDYPDEIDTPHNTPARIRFQKYRGLQSFRSSDWDIEENLPIDYTRIFKFDKFNHIRKRLLKIDDVDGAMPGWYVVLYINDVPRHLYNSHVSSLSPLVVFGLMKFEQKMSLVNVVIKSHQLGHTQPIKSKENLIYHIGFRRFRNCAIFSEHTSGNKHKFARYFHPGQTLVASMYSPVVFPPVPVLVFKQHLDGRQDLVATGTVFSVNPNRIICKRVVLSGHPFKVNKKSCVVRYMFFHREDINYFKSIELRTKWGRRGHIKEPLGTHGHMKCFFDGQLKSQDSILMNLYKRVYPKWTYDPFISRPLSLFSQAQHVDSDSEKEEIISSSVPPSKKTKKVHFISSK